LFNIIKKIKLNRSIIETNKNQVVARKNLDLFNRLIVFGTETRILGVKSRVGSKSWNRKPKNGQSTLEKRRKKSFCIIVASNKQYKTRQQFK